MLPLNILEREGFTTRTNSLDAFAVQIIDSARTAAIIHKGLVRDKGRNQVGRAAVADFYRKVSAYICRDKIGQLSSRKESIPGYCYEIVVSRLQ